MKINLNIERNRLDYVLTDIMPVEVTELFSFRQFYDYLIEHQSDLTRILREMKKEKAKNNSIPFENSWGNWATLPLKYSILKGVDSVRELNLVQPLSALNILFFIECY